MSSTYCLATFNASNSVILKEKGIRRNCSDELNSSFRLYCGNNCVYDSQNHTNVMHKLYSMCVSLSSKSIFKEFFALSSSYSFDLRKFENLKKIENISKFKDNWNGTGGQAFSNAAISNFKKIINELEIQPEIAPTGRNSLLMQYELDDNSMLCFEIKEQTVEKVLIPKGNYALAENEMFLDNLSYSINNCVETFYGFKKH